MRVVGDRRGSGLLLVGLVVACGLAVVLVFAGGGARGLAARPAQRSVRAVLAAAPTARAARPRFAHAARAVRVPQLVVTSSRRLRNGATQEAHRAVVRQISSPFRQSSLPHRTKLRDHSSHAKVGAMRSDIVSGQTGASALTGDYPQAKFYSEPITQSASLGVNVANGNLEVSDEDLNLAGVAGLNLQVGRYYNNLSSKIGSFGLGWTMGPGADSTVTAACSGGGVSFLDGTGVANSFSYGSGASSLTDSAADLQLTWNGSTPATSTQFTVIERHAGITETFATSGGVCGNVARLSLIEDRNGNSISYSYNSYGQLSQITDSYGNRTTIYYNSAGYISQIDDPSGRTYYYSQNSAGELTSYEDPDGHYTYYGYNSAGDLTQIEDPDGNDIDIAYDSDNRVASIERFASQGNTSGPTTTFSYGTPSTQCASSSTATVQTAITDPDLHTTYFCTDSAGRIVGVIDADGNARSTTYDSEGDVAGQTSPAGTQTSFTYSTNGDENLTGVQEGTSTSELTEGFKYNDSSNPYLPTSSTDTQGNTTETSYNDDGDPLNETDSESSDNGASETYNANGTVATSTDALGNVTTYGYTSGNLTSETPPSAVPLAPQDSLRFTYDGANRVSTISWVDPTYNSVDKEISYQYNGIDQITEATYSSATGAYDEYSFQYDNDGNLTQEITPQGTSTWTYNGLGELTAQTFANGTPSVSYGYDAAGNLTSLTNHQGTTNYGYDAANELTSITEPGASTPIGLSYDPDGNLTAINYPDGDSVTYSFDAEDQLIETNDLYKTATGATAHLTYANDWNSPTTGDNTGLIQNMSTNTGAVTTYSYDALNRLTQAKTVLSDSTLADYAYTVDGNGNILQETTSGSQLADGSTSYAYNRDNEICWSDATAITNPNCSSTPSGADSYSYDAYGDETSNGSDLTMAYNVLGQMSSATENGSTTDYSYLGDTQDQLDGEGSQVMSNDILGLASVADPSGSGTDYFIRSIAGQQLAETTPTGTYDYLYDSDGNIIGLTNASTGEIVDQRSYSPYGNTTSSTGTVPLYFGFQSGYQDTSGLDHFDARDYNPGQASWTQQDPLNQIASLTQDDRYSFDGGDPVNEQDPTGDLTVPTPATCAVLITNALCSFNAPLVSMEPAPIRAISNALSSAGNAAQTVVDTAEQDAEAVSEDALEGAESFIDSL